MRMFVGEGFGVTDGSCLPSGSTNATILGPSISTIQRLCLEGYSEAVGSMIKVHSGLVN